MDGQQEQMNSGKGGMDSWIDQCQADEEHWQGHQAARTLARAIGKHELTAVWHRATHPEAPFSQGHGKREHEMAAAWATSRDKRQQQREQQRQRWSGLWDGCSPRVPPSPGC